MTLHPACVVAWILTLAYVGVTTWLMRRARRRTTAALTLAAESLDQAALARHLASESLEHAALAKAQLEQRQQARRTLPEVVRSVALSYAAKAKN